MFISYAKQFIDEESIYRGSILAYERQDEHEPRSRGIIDQLAAYVNEQGFYGPVGADVMTDTSEGKHYVVDMNVRLTGDCMMGPLKG